MKIFTNNSRIQKIIISLITIILINFTIPIKSQAGWLSNTIGQPLLQLVAMIGDAGIGILHKYVLGAEKGFSSVMLSKDNITVTSGDLKGDGTGDEFQIGGDSDNSLDGSIIGTSDVGIPNIMVCPEYIFANRIALLDANFINPGEYDNQKQTSLTSGVLRTTIASWYRAFRNIAVVSLLTILVYIGIRILIGSTAQDKAKYKERLKDWLVGLCLVFAMHYIMAGTMMITEKITDVLDNSIDTGYNVTIDGTPVKENLTGYIRLLAQRKDIVESFAYTIMYIVLVVFTYMFLIKYLKRVLYMAFFTMIAPLVAMTYPLDKMADSRAQGFTTWFKEFMMNALMQPIHLIIYFVFVGSAAELARENVLYAIVAIGFLLPAEKFIKKLFRLDKSETAGSLGDIAGGALALSGMQKLAHAGSHIHQNSSGNSSNTQNNNKQDKIRYENDTTKDLNAWKEDNNNPQLQQEQENVSAQNMFNEPVAAEELSEGAAELATGAYMANDNEETNNDQNENPEIRTENNGQLPEDKEAGEGEGEGEEDNRTLSEYMADRMNEKGKLTPAERFRERIGNIKPAQFASKQINKIPEPARRTIKGVSKTLWRGGKAGLKGVWRSKGRILRTATKLAGAGMGATIGLAAGIATGDLSKAVTFAATGGLAGNAIGNNAANLAGKTVDVAKKVPSAARSIKNAYNEETYGLQEARRMRIESQNSSARAKFMRDKEEKARYTQMAAKLGYGQSQVKDIMERAWNYKTAGIDDEASIETGLKLEKAHSNYTNEQMVNIMQESKKISRDTILDDKKRVGLERSLEAKLQNKEKAQEVMQLIAESHNEGDYYRNIKEKEKQMAQQQVQAAQATRQQSQTSSRTRQQTQTNPTTGQQTPTKVRVKKQTQTNSTTRQQTQTSSRTRQQTQTRSRARQQNQTGSRTGTNRTRRPRKS